MASKRELMHQLESSRFEQQKPQKESYNIIEQIADEVDNSPENLLSELVSVIDRSNSGRPKTLQGVYKPISARLKVENYVYARKISGKYGSMNAYINWLIEQDMKRNSSQN